MTDLNAVPGWQTSAAHQHATEALRGIATPEQFLQWEAERAVIHTGRIRWRLTPYVIFKGSSGKWVNHRDLYETANACMAVYSLYNRTDVDRITDDFSLAVGRSKFGSDWMMPPCLTMGSYYRLPPPPMQIAMWLVHLRADEQFYLDRFGLVPKKTPGSWHWFSSLVAPFRALVERLV